MKNGLKNTAIVLLLLAVGGLVAKIVNDENGWLDRITAKEPAAEGYLQVGDDLLGKTVYFDANAFYSDFASPEEMITLGTLSYVGEAITGGATLVPVWSYIPMSHYMKLGVDYGPTSYVFSVVDTESGIVSHSFPEKIELELTGGSFEAKVTSLKIEALNEGLDLNRYFAYSEEALTEWQSWRKIHPFVTTSEGTSSETTDSSESASSPTSDSASESEVKEKVRIESYVQEITPMLQEDEDGRFGEFC